jgi:hypothetical protein
MSPRMANLRAVVGVDDATVILMRLPRRTSVVGWLRPSWLHDHIVRHARNRARCSGIQAVSGMGRKTRWTSVTRDRDRLKTRERRDQNRARDDLMQSAAARGCAL